MLQNQAFLQTFCPMTSMDLRNPELSSRPLSYRSERGNHVWSPRVSLLAFGLVTPGRLNTCVQMKFSSATLTVTSRIGLKSLRSTATGTPVII